MARLHLTTHDVELAGTDLIIEAVFEDLDLKRKILAATEQHVSPSTVFASNTSALPIASIAEGAQHPERVIGMHYFSPVPKMPLLELVVTPTTADWAVATARAFGIKQGKTVMVVKDGPGFYTSRILSPYLAEATMLVEEGG
jgi:3-hydroxyacyl-CoA dehydrogenase/enoyl-CoA hydratase/3-hydroxybutyryl-CoA epimerase